MSDERTNQARVAIKDRGRSELVEAAAPLAPGQDRPPYFIAGLVALGALLLYVATLAPTTQFWDSSEYMAAATRSGSLIRRGTPCSSSSATRGRSEEHTSELQSRLHLVCRLLLEKK